MQRQETFFGFEDNYKLASIELYNWGGFGGYHLAEIDPDGTAIIGPTGSGKTTLVDALITLLSHNPKYNLASTGGHESDRDLASYMRGVTGPGDGLSQDHISRTGQTVTGIAATLVAGDKIVRLTALFWFESNSHSAADMKRLWLFSTSHDLNLQFFLESLQAGGLRAVRQLEKSHSNLWTYTSKKSYLTRLRDFFEVRENAFNLLNRAAGLKQLNSIDEIFRELVLDDTSQFERAKELSNSFDDLTEIYQELEIARRQQQSLEPVKRLWQKYQKKNEEREIQTQLLENQPVWCAQQIHQRWSAELSRLDEAIRKAQSAKDELEKAINQQEQEYDNINQEYLQLGGSDLETLKQLIEERQKNLQRCLGAVRDYQMVVQRLGLNAELNRHTLSNNQAQVQALVTELKDEEARVNELFSIAALEYKTQGLQLEELKSELEEVKHHRSNIPPKFHAFRALLAEQLGCEEQALPFVAELVQVKSEEQAWRGAIERAIGSQRLRILVAAEHMQTALQWVNHRDNRLHVRLLEVKEQKDTANFMSDGYTRKLNFKEHPFREQVKHLLAQIDLHCVDDIEALQRTPHALTQQGLMSGKARFFDKQDQRSLNDDWCTGFDNLDRLASLELQIQIIEQQLQEQAKIRDQHKESQNNVTQRLMLAEQITHIEFEQIDQVSREAELKRVQDKLANLTAPGSDLSEIKRRLDQSKERLDKLKQEDSNALVKLTQLQSDHKRCEKQKHDAYLVAEKGLDKASQALVDKHFSQFAQRLAEESLDDLSKVERQQFQQLQNKLNQLEEELSDLSAQLVRAMERAKKEDRGDLAEVGSELIDVDDYLKRLEQLVNEALPAKQARFKEYLNRSSDDGVTQLLQTVEGEVDRIRDRLEDVNHTLARVDFQPGRYLQLTASDITHESLRSLRKSLRHLNLARLNDDQGESQYKVLQEIISQLRQAYEGRHRLASKALLDPRFRLEFKVTVLDRETHQVLETRTGSQGGSGGEKEIIASYVLTASLSYALCPDGSDYPLFSSIVLDEAFSRSSHAVAGRIIAALAEFKLHPIFITPNKEMRLLRNHTRSAIVVHRVGSQSSLSGLSWQALDEIASNRHEAQSQPT